MTLWPPRCDVGSEKCYGILAPISQDLLFRFPTTQLGHGKMCALGAVFQFLWQLRLVAVYYGEVIIKLIGKVILGDHLGSGCRKCVNIWHLKGIKRYKGAFEISGFSCLTPKSLVRAQFQIKLKFSTLLAFFSPSFQVWNNCCISHADGTHFIFSRLRFSPD